MSGSRRGLMLLAVLVAMMAGWMNTAAAQVAETTVQDTLYSANGTPASGTVLVSWSAFTTAGGQSVPAGTTPVTIGAGGALTVALAPNAGSTPMGTYYTAVFHLSDGTTSRQYWVVPVTVPGGASTVTLAQIESQVLPISVAMQTVSKEYVDDAIAAASTGFPLESAPYVLTAGDVMTGPLTLPADPVNTNQAADKHYVDTNVSAVEAGIGQKVSLLPSGSQVLAQPGGTSFGVSNTNSSTTFGASGTSTSTAYTAPNSSTQMTQRSLQLMGQGFDLGPNGTSAQGWTSGDIENDNFASAVRGIMQGHTMVFTHSAQGDTSANYSYLDAYGGAVATSDEAVEDTVHQVHQLGYFSGTVSTGGTTGSNLIAVGGSFACHGYCITQANGGFQFPDGGMLLDTTKGGSTATIASYAHDTTNYAMSYTLGSGTVAVSTAWGSIVQSSCTPNGNGQNQAYTSTTCNITLGTSPSSPGSFVAGTDICLAGPFEEEAAVTAVGTPSAGVQAVTFSTRYAWNWYQPAFVMQGGLCGKAFLTNPSWPIAYQALGATTPTTLYFSNCVVGGCNGSNGGGMIPQGPASLSGGTLTRTSNVVTVTSIQNSNLYVYPAGSTLCTSGYTPADLNGCFTVVSNSMDDTNQSITWAQTGANETSSAGGVLTQGQSTITFYPMAFITGTNGGVAGDAQLATNTVAFASGDSVLGAPTSEYASTGIYVVKGQTTGVDGGLGSSGLFIQDDGPAQMQDAIRITNNSGVPSGPYDIGGDVMNVKGAYGNYFNFGYRPANNGSVIFIQGGEPVSPNGKPYYLFRDDSSYLSIQVNPSTNAFSFNGGGATIQAGSIQATAANAASAFSAGTTVGGSTVCTAANSGSTAGCGGGGGGGGPAMTLQTNGANNSSQTALNLVAGSNVTLTAGASGAVTIAASGGGSSLSLTTTGTSGAATLSGGVLNVPVYGGGSGTPALSYEYLRAGLSDGGAAFAGAFTRFDNNQPQAGSVAPATSALGYLLFNASPSAPQYAEVTTTLPPFWTSSGVYLQFYSTATSGSAVMDVQTACVTAGQVVGSPTFTSATTSTTVVSATANGLVQTALIAGIAAPGANGCPATGVTTPTMLTIRVYADASDTVPVYFTGATLVTGRSQ